MILETHRKRRKKAREKCESGSSEEIKNKEGLSAHPKTACECPHTFKIYRDKFILYISRHHLLPHHYHLDQATAVGLATNSGTGVNDFPGQLSGAIIFPMNFPLPAGDLFG